MLPTATCPLRCSRSASVPRPPQLCWRKHPAQCATRLCCRRRACWKKQPTACLAANQVDVANAEAAGTSATLVDRLRLDHGRIGAMAAGLRNVAALADPVGERVDGWVRPNGLVVERVRVPLGVVAIIYESRPNVTSDAFGLCLKSANAAFLRGSSAALQSNIAIAESLREGVVKAGLPADSLAAGHRHPPQRRYGVHAPPLLHRLFDPARWARAHLIGARQRNGALRHRRRRQLPCVCRRRSRPRHGCGHCRQRQAEPAVGMQRCRIPLGPP